MEPIKVKLSSTVIVLLKWGIENNKKFNKSLSSTSSILNSENNKYDYKVMMVKRSNKIKFFPSAHVFPGGALDKHDGSQEWNNVFEKSNSSSDGLVKQLPIKVSALREVLEETNFFLDKNRELINDKTKFEIETLQKNLMDKEKSKENNFLLDYLKKEKLENNITISLNNLYQWARWITPVLGPNQTHRFDTYFYITPIYEYPESCKVDGIENTELDWFSPEEALEEHRVGNISLPPPTWFTFQQLKNLHTLDQVIDVAKQRESSDILYDPKMVNQPTLFNDHHPNEKYQLLRGDSLYDGGKEGPTKNRVIIRSRSNNLANQFSWYYEYLNNIPNSIDNKYNGCKTVLPSKL